MDEKRVETKVPVEYDARFNAVEPKGGAFRQCVYRRLFCLQMIDNSGIRQVGLSLGSMIFKTWFEWSELSLTWSSTD